MAQFETGEAHRPHRQNKADGAPNTNWRELFDDIQTCGLQTEVGDGVYQTERRHIGQRVKQDNGEHRARRGDASGNKQRNCTNQMAE